MNVPQNLRKITEAFGLDQVNALLAEGWCLVAITQRPGAMGPLYTLGWVENSPSGAHVRRAASNRARGITD